MTPDAPLDSSSAVIEELWFFTSMKAFYFIPIMPG
jgi:hypothetical protein